MRAIDEQQQNLVEIPVRPDGSLVNIASWDNISSSARGALREIADAIQAALALRPHMVYVRGSLAYGGFVPAISDLDLVVIAPQIREGDEEALSELAATTSRGLSDWCSMVDISIYTPEQVMRKENNRLYLNIALTGLEVRSCGFKLNVPVPVLGRQLQRDIINQTLADCRVTREVIRARRPVTYMGETRGAEFLCTWFMRDMLRGMIAFVMRERRCFSLHVQTCAALFAQCYPCYRDLASRLSRAEREPLADWGALEALADEALAVYTALAGRVDERGEDGRC